MAYSEKLARQSNGWYNDGLAKAQIRDLSGAMASLERSIEYDRTNITARNLLGLIYYGRGQTGDAIAQWILCQNMDPADPMSGYFLGRLKEEPDELSAINISLRKYNQGLRYCRDHHVDMALLQLSEAVEINPGLLCAWQLLALIYISRRQFSKARRALRQAHMIDEGDQLTLEYMEEARKGRARRTEGGGTRESRHAVSYKRGHETIIRPVQAESGPGSSRIWGNILIGLIMGVAVVFLLVGPLIRSSATNRAGKELAAYTDKIAAQEAQIEALKTELEEYRMDADLNSKSKKASASAQTSYENLIAVSEGYSTAQISSDNALKMLLEVNPDTLGDRGKEKYDKYADLLFPPALTKYYSQAQESYAVGNYKYVIDRLEMVLKMEEDYEDGAAMLMLANSYMKYDGSGDEEDSETEEGEEKKDYKELAKEYYTLIIKNHPDTDLAKAAQKGLDGTPTDVDQLEEENTDSTEENQSGEAAQTADDAAAANSAGGAAGN